jgi:hypothetical protein
LSGRDSQISFSVTHEWSAFGGADHTRHLKVYPADVQMIWPVAGRGRPRQRHVPDILSMAAEDMLADATWQHISWRTGTKGRLKARRKRPSSSNPTSCQPQPIPGIRQHTTEANAGRNDTIDLSQGYLRLRARCSIFGRNTRSLQPSPLACPTLGKKQPQCQHDRYFASRKRQRYQGLAVRGLAQRRSILRCDTHRMRAFLGYRGVVDHQHGIAATDEPIRFVLLLEVTAFECCFNNG